MRRRRTRRVEGEGTPVTNNGTETDEPCHRILGTRDGRRSSDERTGSTCVLCERNSHGDGRRRYDENFEDESVTKVVRVDEEERELDQPEQEVGHHVDGRDPCRWRQPVRNVEVTRPDRVEELGHRESSVVGFDSEPDQGEEETRNDGEEREVVTHRGTNRDGEGHPTERLSVRFEFRTSCENSSPHVGTDGSVGNDWN